MRDCLTGDSEEKWKNLMLISGKEKPEKSREIRINMNEAVIQMVCVELLRVYKCALLLFVF